MKKNKKPLLILIVISIAVVTTFLNLKTSANQLTFSVEPVLPNNQIKGNFGYFNLKMSPGYSQILTLRYTNNTKKNITVNSRVSSAKTNKNGVVDYDDLKTKNDPSLIYDISSLVEMPKNVTLKAGETRNIEVQVKMPNKQFSGIIAGGITFYDSAKDKENKSGKAMGGMSIANIYSFQIGLLIRQSEETGISDSTILSKGLKLKKVEVGQLNYRNAIFANLQNPLPVYVNQFVAVGTVYKNDSSEALYSVTKSSMQMAPNSNFNFPILLGNGEKMKPGRYRVDITAYSLLDKDGAYKTNVINNKIQTYKYRWKFSKSLVITGGTAKKYNDNDVTIKKFDWSLWIIISTIILAFILLILLGILIWKRRQEHDIEIEEEMFDVDNKLRKIIRTVTITEYKELVKAGKNIRVIQRK